MMTAARLIAIGVVCFAAGYFVGNGATVNPAIARKPFSWPEIEIVRGVSRPLPKQVEINTADIEYFGKLLREHISQTEK